MRVIVYLYRATVKDGTETELETGNGRQIFMLQPGVSLATTLHV